MRKLVEFKSEKFPPYENEEEEINPGLWGKRLAEYLRGKLSQLGIPAINIGPEDWGWMVEIENKEFPLWIGCGHRGGEDNEFLCFIEPSKAFVRKGFKKMGTAVQVNRVAEALAIILASDKDIHEIEWFSDEH